MDTKLGTGLVMTVSLGCLAAGIAAGAVLTHRSEKDTKVHVPEVDVSSAFLLYALALAGGGLLGAVAMNATMSDAPQLGA